MLPYKEGGQPGEYITITTSDANGIPRENERVVPDVHAQAMPRLLVQIALWLSGLRNVHITTSLSGLSFLPASDSQYLYNLIDFGGSELQVNFAVSSRFDPRPLLYSLYWIKQGETRCRSEQRRGLHR
jgi:hypothetical protein